jgi:hypothetical protein
MSLGATLIVLIGLVLVVPLGARSARRALDLFEPLVVINVALLVMYVLRPAALLLKEAPYVFKGFDISDMFIGTLAIVVSLTVGSGAFASSVLERLPLASDLVDLIGERIQLKEKSVQSCDRN